MSPVPSLAPKDAAVALGVSVYTIRRWIDRSQIAYVRLPSGRVRIPQHEIDSILAGSHAQPKAVTA